MRAQNLLDSFCLCLSFPTLFHVFLVFSPVLSLTALKKLKKVFLRYFSPPKNLSLFLYPSDTVALPSLILKSKSHFFYNRGRIIRLDELGQTLVVRRVIKTGTVFLCFTLITIHNSKRKLKNDLRKKITYNTLTYDQAFFFGGA